jgi:uncharacterized membrane protein HdeD (DUF308 family)
MMRFNSNMNFADEFAKRWNKKLKSVRTVSLVISILMVALGIICFIFPMKTVTALEVIACILVILFGIYEIIDYCKEPVWFRYPGKLIGGILNILICLMLVSSPKDVTISTFAFLFGWILMIAGIEKISFGSKLNYFSISDYGWVNFSGIFNVIAALFFIFFPLVSTIALNMVLAIYLLVGGISLFIEAISMKDLKLDNDDNIIDV